MSELQKQNTSQDRRSAGLCGNTGMMDILRKFCDPDNELLSEPWSDGEWSFASNGFVAVRIPRLAGVDRDPPYSFASSLPFGAPVKKGVWVDLPEYTLPPATRCGTCGGSGKLNICPECEGAGELEVDSGFNIYNVDCATCGGVGGVPGNSTTCGSCAGKGVVYKEQYCLVEFGTGGIDVNGFLLEQIKDLPGIKIFTAPTTGMFHFRFDGGDGILMGLEQD